MEKNPRNNAIATIEKASTDKPQFMLEPTTTLAQAFDALRRGETTAEAIEEWQAGIVAAARAQGEKAGRAAASCPITAEQFAKLAKPFDLTIGDQVFTAKVKAPFKSGSFGWNCTAKPEIEVPGFGKVRVQAGINFVVIGSKPKADGTADDADGEGESAE